MTNTISVEQIKKLIEDYWGYERECMGGEYSTVARNRAALYRTVIRDLEKLLPRKSMADIDPETWPKYEVTWAEWANERVLILKARKDNGGAGIRIISPKGNTAPWIDPESVFPLDEHSPALDSDGDPI